MLGLGKGGVGWGWMEFGWVLDGVWIGWFWMGFGWDWMGLCHWHVVFVPQTPLWMSF